MTALAMLTDRNRAFAAGYPRERPALEPRLKTVILCCADHRADPAHSARAEAQRGHRHQKPRR
jgi:carbonic anhydrase